MNRNRPEWAVWLKMVILTISILGSAWGQAPPPGFSQSIVMVRAVRQGWDYKEPWQQEGMAQGVGTGFIIEGNRIVTNAHNVSDCKYIELKKQNQAKRYLASIAFIGHDCDLALLNVADASFFAGTTPLEIGALPSVNSTVQTVGFPMGGQDVSITEGVVSRIQMDSYSHSGADAHLVIQTDAAINPGNSGGPVLQQGKVVGVAFQGLRAADNIGYMIPTTVIRHFLKDIEDGKYDGFGSLGFIFAKGLHSKSYREYLKVPEGASGVVVIRPLINTSVQELFEKNDVITKIDEYEVNDDGQVKIYGLMLDMSEVTETRQIGEKVKLTFLRGGERHEVEATVALNRGAFEYAREYDMPPRYAVFAGLVFQGVSRNFLETWGASWPSELPHNLRYLVSMAQELNTEKERREWVVLGSILADEINAYSEDFRNQIVESINGKPVWRLEDVAQGFENPEGDFVELRFLGQKLPLVLKAAAVKARMEDILKKYQIAAGKRL